MFDRYSELARRVLFFARYEVSALGAETIEPDHVLLGLLRETKGNVHQLLAHWNIPVADLRREIEQRATHDTKPLHTAVEVPFARPTKRMLTHAVEEADRLLSGHIEPEHLLLALLRENDSVASVSLAAYGMTVDAAREYLASRPASALQDADTDVVQSEDPLATTHIERIMQLVRDLAQTAANTDEARALVNRIDDELMMLRLLLK